MDWNKDSQHQEQKKDGSSLPPSDADIEKAAKIFNKNPPEMTPKEKRVKAVKDMCMVISVIAVGYTLYHGFVKEIIATMRYNRLLREKKTDG